MSEGGQTEPFIFEGIGSVLAIYQGFEPGTKIQSDFCPRLFRSFIE